MVFYDKKKKQKKITRLIQKKVFTVLAPGLNLCKGMCRQAAGIWAIWSEIFRRGCPLKTPVRAEIAAHFATILARILGAD